MFTWEHPMLHHLHAVTPTTRDPSATTGTRLENCFGPSWTPIAKAFGFKCLRSEAKKNTHALRFSFVLKAITPTNFQCQTLSKHPRFNGASVPPGGVSVDGDVWLHKSKLASAFGSPPQHHVASQLTPCSVSVSQHPHLRC